MNGDSWVCSRCACRADRVSVAMPIGWGMFRLSVQGEDLTEAEPPMWYDLCPKCVDRVRAVVAGLDRDEP